MDIGNRCGIWTELCIRSETKVCSIMECVLIWKDRIRTEVNVLSIKRVYNNVKTNHSVGKSVDRLHGERVSLTKGVHRLGW